MKRLMQYTAVIVALFFVLSVPAGRALVMPNVKLGLTDGVGVDGGFVQVQMDDSNNLRIVVSLKTVAPNTLYTVWLISCAGAPGGHPCVGGPLTSTAPFGNSSPGCAIAGSAGPLTTVMTNGIGNGNTGDIIIALGAVAPGTYFNHVDVGNLVALPLGCHPDGLYPAGFFATPGFSFTI